MRSCWDQLVNFFARYGSIDMGDGDGMNGPQEYASAAIPSRAPRRELSPSQLDWLDKNLCVAVDEQRFKRFREQAIAARGPFIVKEANP